MSRTAIEMYKSQSFKYIHYGLIKVVVKPMNRIGINNLIFLALRDKRLIEYQDSILALIQTNICDGSISFNCVPNFLASLDDELILDSLIMDIQIDQHKIDSRSRSFVVLYKVCFKLLKTLIDPRLKLEQTNTEETIIFEQDSTKSSVYIPKTLKWEEITIPQTFTVIPQIQSRNIQQTNTSKIVKQKYGSIVIHFDEIISNKYGANKSFIQPARHLISEIPNLRRSFSQNTNFEINPEIYSIPISGSQRIHYKSPLPEIIDTSSLPRSPTPSEIKPDSVYMKSDSIIYNF